MLCLEQEDTFALPPAVMCYLSIFDVTPFGLLELPAC
jgi:hypothetical protein